MRILITGGSGFLGKHIIESLTLQEHKILATTLTTRIDMLQKFTNVDWITIDLSNVHSYRNQFINFDPELVIHLAWQDIPDYSFLTSSKNLVNSVDLVNFLITNTRCRRFIIAGSCMEYSRRGEKCQENGPTAKDNYFSWAKSSLREYLSLLSESDNIDITWFRIFYVYGIGQRSDALIPSIAKSLRAGMAPTIRNLHCFNDFIYVKDVAKLFDLCVNRQIGTSGVFNVGTGELHSVLEVSRLVELNITGRTIINDKVEQPTASIVGRNRTELHPFRADPSKTQRVFNWDAEWSLDRGIENYCHELELGGYL